MCGIAFFVFPDAASISTVDSTGTSRTVLSVIQPTFEQFCSTVSELGWNDLLFQTQGAFCFRGTKISGNAAASRTISNHAYGIAYDVMNHENEQGTRHATTDPRIVAVFDAFHFQWGLSFATARSA